jgi:hypothetical protein
MLRFDCGKDAIAAVVTVITRHGDGNVFAKIFIGFFPNFGNKGAFAADGTFHGAISF